MPSSPSRPARLGELFAKPFAHRGLHGRGMVENSPSAFRAALDAGHGIELDVQVSADGEAIVFHDYDLRRLAGADGKLADLPAAAISAHRLTGTEEAIPILPDILALIDGRAPLLIEVKSPGRDVAPLCEAVNRALASYIGPVAVMSFNPAIGHWFAKRAPDVLRGLVVTEEGRPRHGWLKRWLSLRWSRADFLAYDIRDLPSRFVDAVRAKGMKVGTWTVRTDAQRTIAAASVDQIIYEVPA
ncbi:glycerophosphodiester phosphodiesterase family protein [Sphingosinicella sp. LHD-64]|uniref:glycerophosphodiester phosphodiesterase family protein n=1 Tax=Sphingosinicella sp. LHD-64 TaxID=3072139 RepID=UPI00280E8BD6|nr:glycerophosphodiester phosphodiesterase family protein [Sphingosinicella sp. LHD-64]MDQ8756810.1 glycerophosphodiester phosphodiesterase family protein [Sphingosinicella sp. LHD-64]